MKDLVSGLRARYDQLGKDQEVREALTTLNQGSSRRYALGPREDYAANVRKIAAALLASKGFQADRDGKSVELGADVDLRTATFLMESCRRDLAEALGRRESWRRAAEVRHRTVLDQRRQPDSLEEGGSGKSTDLANYRSRLTRLAREEAEAARARVDLETDLHSRREQYLRAAEVLRKAVTVSRKKNAELEGDADVRQALSDLKARRAGRRPPEHEGLLAEIEASIRSETIPLSPDRTGQCATVSLNGTPGLRVVIDPSVETSRVSERFAASIQLKPVEGEPPVTIPSPEGPPLEARRARLSSVQIGPFSLIHNPPVID